MAVFTRVKTWVSNEVLTASDLNSEFNNLLNNTIPASIEDYSADVSTMQTTADPGGVGTESLATTLAGELARIRYAIKRIAGGAQWYVAPAIGRTSLASVGQQLSSSCSIFSTTSISLVDITNLTVTITTTGRPVVIALLADGSPNASYIYAGKNSTSLGSMYATFAIVRDSTVISRHLLSETFAATTDTKSKLSPSSSINHIDVVAAGTYTYKLQAKADTNLTASVGYAKLIAYEL